MFYGILKILTITIVILLLLFLVVYILVFSSEWKKRKQPQLESDFEKERAKDYPPAFPNGWFHLCASRDIKKKQIKEVNAFGKKLAVYRTESGKVAVIGAFCPHLGANLTDGRVKDETLICPFHGWNFNTKGVCTKIPYAKNNQPNRYTNGKTWVAREQWGLVMVWYHSNNEPPQWHMNTYLPQLNEYKFIGVKKNFLNIHLQEFFENGADYAHFSEVHNLLTIPFVNRWVHIKHNPKISFGTGEEGHMAFFNDTVDIVKNKDNTVIKSAQGKGDVTFFGPGILAFNFTTNVANPIIIKTFTPIGDLKVKMTDYVYAPKGTLKLAAKIVVKEASAQFDDDIRIWEKKIFLKKPKLVKGDGPIMKMRKWYSQFYTETNYKDIEEKKIQYDYYHK